MSESRFTKLAVGVAAIAAVKTSIDVHRQTKIQEEILQNERNRVALAEREQQLRNILFSHQELAGGLGSMGPAQGLYWALYLRYQNHIKGLVPDNFTSLSDKQAVADFDHELENFTVAKTEELKPEEVTEIAEASTLTVLSDWLTRYVNLRRFQSLLPGGLEHSLRALGAVAIGLGVVPAIIAAVFQSSIAFSFAFVGALITLPAWKDRILRMLPLRNREEIAKWEQGFGVTVNGAVEQIELGGLVREAELQCRGLGYEITRDLEKTKVDAEEARARLNLLLNRYALEG